VGNQDEAQRALELRVVLDQILQFEKTECPFKRGFTVELPERPQTPVKKRPWTPVSRRSSSAFLPPTPVTPASITPIQKTRDEVPASPLAITEVEILDEVVLSADSKTEDPGDGHPVISEESQKGDSAVVGTVEGAVSALEHVVQEQKDADLANRKSTLAKPSGFQANRSVTAPPQLTLITTSSSSPVSLEATTEEIATLEVVTDRSGQRSPTDSSDGSFHSVESWTSAGSPLPPSPPLTASGSPTVTPYSQQYLYVPKKAHQQDGSDLTMTPNTPRTLTGHSSEGTDLHEPVAQDTSGQADEASSTCSVHTVDESLQSPTSTTQTELSSTPASSSAPTAQTTSTTITRTDSATSSSSTVLTRRPYMRHQPTTSSSISPSRGAPKRLPSAADLFPTYRSSSCSTSTSQPKATGPSRLALVRNLPKAIIHKTLEILLSPPSHLVDLMLKVAARIAAGEWRGYVFGFGEGGERIPVRWDWSDGDDDGGGELGGWGADEDWEFAQTTRRRESGFRMAGAYPESPEEVERQFGPGEAGEVPGSPSLERKKGKGSVVEQREEGRDDEDEKDAADGGADWTGNLSID
jgi:hypothetical protein